MADDSQNGRTPEEIDAGAPIDLLKDLQEPSSKTFMGSLHSRIQRRVLTTDVTRLAWNGPTLVIIEFLHMLFGLLGARGTNDRQTNGEGDDNGND
jgi:hypothetical protein